MSQLVVSDNLPHRTERRIAEQGKHLGDVINSGLQDFYPDERDSKIYTQLLQHFNHQQLPQ